MFILTDFPVFFLTNNIKISIKRTKIFALRHSFESFISSSYGYLKNSLTIAPESSKIQRLGCISISHSCSLFFQLVRLTQCDTIFPNFDLRLSRLAEACGGISPHFTGRFFVVLHPQQNGQLISHYHLIVLLGVSLSCTS